MEEQQRMLNILNESLSQVERAEHMGRLKQINEQSRLANEQWVELKSKKMKNLI
jgi:hypothetical protein